MSEELDKRSQPDPLNLAGAEWAARVEWVKGQIAENCYIPMMPPKAWAGRDDMLAATAQQFAVSLTESAGIVDAAVIELCSLDREDPTTALKRTMLLRLIGIRKLVMKYLAEGRIEMTYKYTDPEEGSGKVKRLPFKEKKYTGIDMAAIGRLLELERNIAELQGLKGTDDTVATFSITDELDKVLDGDGKRKVALSLSQKLKSGEIKNLSPDGMKMLEAALNEAQKPIEAEVVELEEDPEEDEDE